MYSSSSSLLSTPASVSSYPNRFMLSPMLPIISIIYFLSSIRFFVHLSLKPLCSCMCAFRAVWLPCINGCIVISVDVFSSSCSFATRLISTRSACSCSCISSTASNARLISYYLAPSAYLDILHVLLEAVHSLPCEVRRTHCQIRRQHCYSSSFSWRHDPRPKRMSQTSDSGGGISCGPRCLLVRPEVASSLMVPLWLLPLSDHQGHPLKRPILIDGTPLTF